ncbi:MAG: hypothetical protein Q9M39_06740 [Sulfurovum sp.]|nr:hypothetical protein [Sulfurovum sp.]
MNTITMITLSAVTIALLSGCGETTVNQTPSDVNIVIDSYNGNTTPTVPTEPTTPPEESGCVDPSKQETLSGDLTNDRTLTADTLWILDGLVAVKNGATLTIEPCTTIAGLAGTGDATSFMIIDKGSKIMAEGESSKAITFTSAKVAVDGGKGDVGQWGGLTLIGHAGNDQVNPYEVNTAFC